jgi:hypothetical protein
VSWLERWNQFWFAPASPYPLAAFRILLGGYLVVYLGTFAPHAVLMFSSQGVYVPYLVPDYAPGPVLAVLLFAAFWLCAFALLLGVRTNITIPLLIVLYLHHYFLALGVKHSSFERLIFVYLLALAPSHADAVWSLLPPSAAERSTTVAFAGRVVRFQTIILYIGAGLWKAINPAWSTGALLHATMQGIWATPLAFWIVRLGFSDAAWTLASHAVIAYEIAIGVLLFFRRTRLLGVWLGCLFHLANSTILSIPEFLVCLAPYPLFLPERYFLRIDRSMSALRRRLRALRKQPEA